MKRQLVALSLLATLAAAQPQDPVLSGPVIETSPDHATLVRWGYDGRLEPLDTTPAQAAAEILELTAEQRDSVNDILARRMATFDKTVIESIDLVVRFQSAQALKDYGAMGSLIGQFIGRFGTLVAQGPAALEITGALPPEAADRFLALVEEYNRATITDEKRLAEHEGRKFKPIDALLKARGDELAREIDRAVKRSAAMGDAGYEIFLQSLNLEPDVESMIRTRTNAFARAHDFNPSKKEEDAFNFQLFVDLDRETRVKVMSGMLRYQSRGLDYGYGDPMTASAPDEK